MRRLLAAFAALVLLAAPALAVQPDEILKDPALEARARALSTELRCLVCQNQSIDDSNAPLARDLRLIVRERLTAGDSDAEVLRYVVARYGDFVLLRPPLKAQTILLWAAPALVLLAGLAWLALRIRRPRPEPAAAPLSDAERRALEKALSEEG